MSGVLSAANEEATPTLSISVKSKSCTEPIVLMGVNRGRFG